MSDKKRVVRKKKFESHDFSFTEIINAVYRNCSFINCKLEKTVFKNTVFINCRFVDTNFTNCQFTDCQLANNIGKRSGVFENVLFQDCRFTRSDFNFPIIKDCRFIDNLYVETDFDGSRLHNTKFIGEMESVEFRGYSVLATTDWMGMFKRVEPRKYKNPMDNVDFTEARFRYVGFSNGINLANCKFRSDENGFLINNPRSCFAKAKAIIESSWSPNDKKRALHLIDTFLFTRNHETMPLIYFYKRPAVESLKDFDEKLFALLKKINEDQAA